MVWLEGVWIECMGWRCGSLGIAVQYHNALYNVRCRGLRILRLEINITST